MLSKLITWPYPGHARATVSEFLVQYQRCTSQEERVKELRSYLNATGYGGAAIQRLMESLFYPGIEFNLPSGSPGYKAELHPEKAPNSLGKRARSLHYFVKGANGAIENKMKREAVFIQFLESMSQGDAFVFIAIKDRNAAAIGLTHEDVHAAFPNWIPAPIVKPAVQTEGAPDPKKESGGPSDGSEKRGRGRPKKVVGQ